MLPARDGAGAGWKAAKPSPLPGLVLPLPTIPLTAASPVFEMSQVLPEL